MRRLIDNGLPVKEKKVRRCRFKVVDIEDFWKWAEQNKSLLNFSKMQPYCFGAEPDWVKVKRENDKRQSWQQVPHNTPWTEYDDQKLRRMLKTNRYTYTDLSRELRRTEGAVKRRIADLQIKEKPEEKQSLDRGRGQHTPGYDRPRFYLSTDSRKAEEKRYGGPR